MALRDDFGMQFPCLNLIALPLLVLYRWRFTGRSHLNRYRTCLQFGSDLVMTHPRTLFGGKNSAITPNYGNNKSVTSPLIRIKLIPAVYCKQVL